MNELYLRFLDQKIGEMGSNKKLKNLDEEERYKLFLFLKGYIFKIVF